MQETKKRKGISVHHEGSVFVVQLYHTYIVTFEGSIATLTTGGWRTKHSKNCINDAIGDIGHVSIRKGQWYFQGAGMEKPVPFEDGMRIDFTDKEAVKVL